MSAAVTSERLADATTHPSARITGVIYLLYFLAAVVGEFFTNRLVVAGNAASTATNIQAHEASFRLGVSVSLVAIALYIALTARFYDLFMPVNRNLALLAAFFSLVGCAVQAFASLFLLAPLLVLGDSQYLSVFTLEQRQALALMSLRVNAQALSIGLVFFGLFCLLIGYLIFRSTFLPRILGALMAAAGLGWLTFLSAPLAQYLSPYVQILGVLAEGALMVWLLAVGVNEQRWREQVSVAKASLGT